MKSKFVRFLFIQENKFSELTKGFIALIPKINNMKNINDESVYNYFNFDINEIKLIENSHIISFKNHDIDHFYRLVYIQIQVFVHIM